MVSVKTGQLDKAIAIDKKLARIKPSASVFNNLGVIYSKKGDLNNALMYFNKALSLDYSFNEANFNKANILWRKGRFKQAEHIYFSEISKYPGEYRARYALIQMYLETKQELAAIRASKDVLASQNNDPEGLVGLGAMFASRRYPQEALGFFIKALSVDDAFSEAYIHMGQLLFDQGKQEEALRVWQKGLEHCPNNVQLRKMIADVDTVRRLR